MTEHQRLFQLQARADFEIFQLLRSSEFPVCQALHYLQMSTELLGKAYIWKDGRPSTESHKAFAKFVRMLAGNPKARKRFGFDKKKENWEHLMRKSGPLAEGIQNLAPAIAQDGPNPEYPWPRGAPITAPAEYEFEIWEQLKTDFGRQFLEFVGRLFAEAEAFL